MAQRRQGRGGPPARSSPPLDPAPVQASVFTPVRALTERDHPPAARPAAPGFSFSRVANHERSREESGRAREWVLVLVISLALAVIARMYFFSFAVVDGPSMETNFHTGMRVIASLWDFKMREPVRGEVVICTYPNMKNIFVKRVIGLPYEKIEVRDGVVYIDNRPILENYIENVASQDFGPVELKPDEYFVIGDNRNNSADSRHPRVGPLKISNILGHVFFIVWPTGDWQGIDIPLYPLPTLGM